MQPLRQPSNPARRGILADHAFAGGLAQHLHGLAQACCGGFLITTLNRFKRTLRDGTQAHFDRVVAEMAFDALTEALFRRRMNWNMRHNQF